MKKMTILGMFGALLLAFSGCRSTKQVVSSDPVCLPAVSVHQAMEAARSVLEEMQFSLEKDDVQAGYIRTRPLSGGQFFQVWRQDNASSSAAAESNLQSIRRIVEVQATADAARVCLECRVNVQQLSLPEEPIRGYQGLAGNYTDSSATRQTLRLEGKQLEEMEWLDKGLDRALEQKITQKIKQKVTQ